MKGPMDKKVLYLDTETTGINPVTNDVIHFAFGIEINGELVETVEFKSQPFSYENINLESLTVNNTTIELLKTYPNPSETCTKILQFFCKYCNQYDKSDKFYPAGYNLHFDLDFISNFFIKNNYKYFGAFCNWKRIDLLPFLYKMDLMDQIALSNYKLATVCEHYGIPIKAHDALSDLLATRELMIKILHI